MMKVDRLLIGALVLGVWALVAVQFFDGVTVEAAAFQAGSSYNDPLWIRSNPPLQVNCQ